MRIIKNKVAFLFILTFLFFCKPAWGIQFNNIVFIGDSLTDQGKCKNPFNPIVPLTNGNTYAFYLGQKLGLPVVPSTLIDPVTGTYIGGNDFACVGASTGFNSGVLPHLIQNGLKQVDEAIASNIPFNSKTLFMYWLGADDILLQPGGTEPIHFYPAFNAAASANNIKKALDKLHQAGARYIIVLNMPDLSKVPAASNPAVTAPIGPQSRELNQVMLETINNLGYEVIQLDIFSVMNQVLANSARFGYTNITTGCSTTPGQDCATSFYFDDVHPTDKTHRIINDFIYSVLVMPEFVATLAEVPFSMIQTHYAKIRQQLYPTQALRDTDHYYPFVSGAFAPQEEFSVPLDRRSYRGNNRDVTVGIIKPVNELFAVGAAVGHTYNPISYDQNGSGFNAKANEFSLFATFTKGRFYLNSIVNYAHLHYTDIERKFMIGPALITAQGETEGDQHGIAFDGGYNLSNRDDIQFGPTASVEYQSVNVNGYSETGSEAFDFVFDNQSNSSLIGSAGWQVVFNNIPYTSIPVRTQLFVNVNKEFHGGDDDVRPIYFHQASLDANFASLPVNTPAPTFGEGGINFVAQINRYLTLSLGYLGTLVDDGSSSHLILAGLTLAL